MSKTKKLYFIERRAMLDGPPNRLCSSFTKEELVMYFADISKLSLLEKNLLQVIEYSIIITEKKLTAKQALSKVKPQNEPKRTEL